METLPRGPDPAAGDPEAAPSPEGKECVACLERIRAQARVCPSCGTKVALLEETDREPLRFLAGSSLLVLGGLLPWGVVPSRWLGELARAAWILLGLWGMWRMWVAILARRVSPSPLLLQVVPFFWGLRFVALPLLSDPRGEVPAWILEVQAKSRGEAGLPEFVADLGLRLEVVGVGPILVLLGSAVTLASLVASVVSGARGRRARAGKGRTGSGAPRRS